MSRKQLVIANLGSGNLHSVQKAVEHVAPHLDVCVSNDSSRIASADYLVLPGQGALGTWMTHLAQNSATKSAILSRLKDGPVLGICVGLQALFDSGEESGGTQGLGLFRGQVRHFKHAIETSDEKHKLKIPHMGWNTVKQQPHPLWHNIVDQSYFYFVHSYYADCTQEEAIVGRCHYGLDFTAAVANKQIFACQFHPEKSADAGLQLLNNFVHWQGDE